MTIEILLVDDRCLITEGIKAILKDESEIKVVGTAKDGQSAIAQVIKLRPDLVLMDIEMPRMNGIVATKYICQNMPDTQVIVLSSYKEQQYITEALQAGAAGYLLKDTLIQDLKQAIYSLGRGYSYIEAKLLTQAVDRVQTANITKYQEQIAYLKKYRKSIYKPSFRQRNKKSKKVKPQIRSQALNPRRSSSTGITKASLAPIFESPTAPDLLLLNRTAVANQSDRTAPERHRQRQLKKIILALMAIASFILSLIIF
ncbi:MAG: response regulator transcription factor [Cyanobacteria bacterium J06623_7]